MAVLGFDFASYSRLPQANTAALELLGRVFLRHQLEAPSAQAQAAAAELEAVLAKVKAELVKRRNETEAPEYGTPVKLDGGVDAIWNSLRKRLEGLDGFEHPGLDPLINRGDALGQTLAKLRKKAERGRAISMRLFGADGLRFTNLAFHEQASVMHTILGLIDEADLEPEIDEIAGPDIVASLRGCQDDYDDMVDDRLSQEQAPKILGALHGELRDALSAYVFAVLGTVSKQKPESIPAATAALRPLLRLRELMASGQGQIVEAELDDEAEDEAADAEPEAADEQG